MHIPECLAGQPIVVGVDEAGRGPVLGPLVYSVAFWPQSEDEEISRLAFNDSKQLSHTERENLLKKIIAHPSIGYVIEEIDSVTISEVRQLYCERNPSVCIDFIDSLLLKRKCCGVRRYR